jgi:GDP-4-dehydro-6-deoxy-D-mannose reductase
MKYFITGVSGFVSSYVVEQLAILNTEHEVWGVDVREPLRAFSNPHSHLKFFKISLLDRDALRALLCEFEPDRIIHLAALSSVAFSWENPVECFLNNTNIFLNLVETVREIGLQCRILSVGSSEEYGVVSPQEMPLSEDRCTAPLNPYAVARVAQEHISKLYAQGYGLSIICTRSFNHLGPRQPDNFVVSSFVRQAVEVALDRRQGITCGRLDIVRDFIDVRDVVKAYLLLMETGTPGKVYNVCSGQGTNLVTLLEKICSLVGIPPDWTVDKSLIRPLDNPVIIGDNRRLSSLGFKQAYNLENSLKDIIIYWQKALIASDIEFSLLKSL